MEAEKNYVDLRAKRANQIKINVIYEIYSKIYMNFSRFTPIYSRWCKIENRPYLWAQGGGKNFLKKFFFTFFRRFRPFGTVLKFFE